MSTAEAELKTASLISNLFYRLGVWWLFLIALLGIYHYTPGPVVAFLFVGMMFVFHEHFRTLLLVGFLFTVYAWLPLPVFYFIFALTILLLPDTAYPEGYAETYRAVEIRMTRAAIEQAVAHMRQLGMELTSHAIDYDFSYLLKLDREPQYYRQFRAKLARLISSVMTIREVMPRDMLRGFDYQTMDQIILACTNAVIEENAKTRREKQAEEIEETA